MDAEEVLCAVDIKAAADDEVLVNARKWARLNLLAAAGVLYTTANRSGLEGYDVGLLEQVAFIADEWASEALHRFGRKAVA